MEDYTKRISCIEMFKQCIAWNMKLKGYIVNTCRSYEPLKFPDRNMKYKEI